MRAGRTARACAPCPTATKTPAGFVGSTDGSPPPVGDELIVVGSNFGRRAHPAWYHNLRARPHAAVDGAPVAARLLEGGERERALALAVHIYPGYLAYRERAAHREIGVFRLRRAPAT
jgi:deazaflavin-dependent oxidoreductase (nitroreductase family)